MNTQQRKPHLLQSNLFLLGLLVLLINDHILKYAFPSVITGKLSDFAGLFIFPIFFSAIWFKHRRLIYVLTGFLFVYWKMPISDGFIGLWNSLNIFLVGRTVDVTDFIALLILPASYSYIHREMQVNLFRRIKPVLIGSVAIIAFCATSLPRQSYESSIGIGKSYYISMTKDDFFDKVEFNTGLSNNKQKNAQDSLFYCYFHIPENATDVTAVINLSQTDDGTIKISLDSISEYIITGRLFKGVKPKHENNMEAFSEEDFERYFNRKFIMVLKGDQKSDRPLYIDNKQLYDDYTQRMNLERINDQHQ